MPKRAIPEGYVGPLGVDGDGHAHPQIHGGPEKAVLILSIETIEELCALGYPLYAGALGENFTTVGVDRKLWRSGQRWRIGEVVIELTEVREPCSALKVYGPGIGKAMFDVQVSAGDFHSPKWGMSGFYASVARPGMVRAGDPMMLLDEAV